MLSVLRRARKSLGRLLLVLCAVALAACVPSGPRPAASARGGAVQVALLVPVGLGPGAGRAVLARSLENAARLAMADLSGVKIDLRVYQTGGQPGTGRSAGAAGGGRGRAGHPRAVLFAKRPMPRASRWPQVGRQRAGLLEQRRPLRAAMSSCWARPSTTPPTGWSRYAVRSGKSKVLIVHDRNVAGEVGRAAIERGVAGGRRLGRRRRRL